MGGRNDSGPRFERFYTVLNVTAAAISLGALLQIPTVAAVIDRGLGGGEVPGSQWAMAATVLTGFVGTLYLLFTRNKDELIRDYWRRAASFTFAVLLLWPVFAGVITGLQLGLTYGADLPLTGEFPELVSAELFQMLMIVTFLVSFYWHRHRGARA